MTYPLSRKRVPSRGILYLLQYSYIFFHVGHATFSSLHISFSATTIGQSHLKCPISQHLKHYSSFFSYLLTFTSSFTPHLIILLTNTSNLLWEIGLLFSTSLHFLQLWTRCPNSLQPKYFLFSLPSSFALNLVRVCH